jgi:ABC-type transporter Mla subunit MlaD
MNLENLTPHLQTRIGRMERAVGWFVLFSALLLLLGFGYYFVHLAGQRGWFLIKAKFFTYVQSAAGLNVGDPVVLMGFQVGQITSIHAMPPFDPHNIKVEFEIKEPYFSYVLSEGTQVEVTPADFLGKRQIEVTRGAGGFAIYTTYKVKKLSLDEMNTLSDPDNWCLAQNLFDENTNLVFPAYTTLARTNLVAIAALKPDSLLAFHTTGKHEFINSTWDETLQRYEDYDARTDGPRWLRADETPTVTEQAEALVAQVREALPNILALTNNIASMLDTMSRASSNFGVAFVKVQPALTNLSDITAQLRMPGNTVSWAFGTNVSSEVQGSLTNVNILLANLTGVASNLNLQITANSNFISNLSTDVVDVDGFIHGLERERLLRSAFRTQTARTNTPSINPRGRH